MKRKIEKVIKFGTFLLLISTLIVAILCTIQLHNIKKNCLITQKKIQELELSNSEFYENLDDFFSSISSNSDSNLQDSSITEKHNSSSEVDSALMTDSSSKVDSVSVVDSSEFDSSSLDDSLSDSDYEVTLTPQEMNLIVLAVQHEVGNSPDYYPGYDFDTIQKYMASVIINRVKSEQFPDTVSDVLQQPGQFMSLSELSSFNENDERTKANVIEVLKGNFKSNTLFERSSLTVPNGVKYYAITSDGRYLIFN